MVPMKISGTSLATVTMPTQGTKRHPSTIVWFPITNVYSSNDMYEDYLHTYFQATQVSGSSYFWHHVNKNVHLSKNKIVYNIFCSSDGWLLYSLCACLWCSNVKYSNVLAWKHQKKCVQRSLLRYSAEHHSLQLFIKLFLSYLILLL